MNETTFNTDKIIGPMYRFAEQIVNKTIAILDHSPIHKSKKFMAKIKQWEEDDLLICFLLPYSPELNLIEILWRRIKYNWLSFDAYLCFPNLRTLRKCLTKHRLEVRHYILAITYYKLLLFFNHKFYMNITSLITGRESSSIN